MAPDLQTGLRCGGVSGINWAPGASHCLVQGWGSGDSVAHSRAGVRRDEVSCGETLCPEAPEMGIRSPLLCHFSALPLLKKFPAPSLAFLIKMMVQAVVRSQGNSPDVTERWDSLLGTLHAGPCPQRSYS